MLANLVAGIFAHHAADDFKTALAARIAQPENCLAPNLVRLARRHQFFERLVRGRIRVHRDGGRRAIRLAHLFVRTGGGILRHREQQSDAFGRRHTGQPNERQAAGVQSRTPA